MRGRRGLDLWSDVFVTTCWGQRDIHGGAVDHGEVDRFGW